MTVPKGTKPMCNFFDVPIKSRNLPESRNICLAEKNEPFVDVEAFSYGKIKVNMQYKAANIPGAISKAYVRKSVAEMLMKAQALLPEGYTFEILDAWRPYEVQLHLFNTYKNDLISDNPDLLKLSEEELIKKVCEFVSYPDKSKRLSFVHSSGGAIDLTILDEKGNSLDMGTEFDDFTDKAYTSWFEEHGGDETIIRNRRLLCNVMTSVGFTNYPAEWWHYDFGDVFWAFYSGENAVFASEYEVCDNF